MSINPGCPQKPSAGERCPGEGSPAYMWKQNSGELPALVVMLLTNLLSQAHEWILLHKIQFEGLCFGAGLFYFLFSFIISLYLEG